jgi:alpha-ribazole phosphatase
MLKLILVRHGETDSNKNATYCGFTDAPLNDNGAMQAQSAKEKLKAYAIDQIYASPLARTKKTAEIINESRGIDICYLDYLKERNFGKWEDLSFQQIKERYSEQYEQLEQDWINYVVPDGECALTFHERVTSFIQGLMDSCDNKTVLIITHLGCIRSMIAFLLGMKIEDMWRFKVDNGGITCIEITEGYAVLTLLNG